MKSLLEFSLAYAARCLVLPLAWIIAAERCGCRLGTACPRPGKHPLTRNGVNDATTDLDAIKAWWARWPFATIGIATGRRSGLVVIDVAPRSSDDETLRRLIRQYGELPETPLCAPGGGG